jgi:hypothetical protein
MSSMDESGNSADGERVSRPGLTPTQIRIEYLERALITLKNIARGSGSDPKVYAQNTLESMGEKY